MKIKRIIIPWTPFTSESNHQDSNAEYSSILAWWSNVLTDLFRWSWIEYLHICYMFMLPDNSAMAVSMHLEYHKNYWLTKIDWGTNKSNNIKLPGKRLLENCISLCFFIFPPFTIWFHLEEIHLKAKENKSFPRNQELAEWKKLCKRKNKWVGISTFVILFFCCWWVCVFSQMYCLLLETSTIQMATTFEEQHSGLGATDVLSPWQY